MSHNNQDFVFCVDSDGCAMDTMTYKHQLFFGPLACELFQVDEKETFLKEWDRVNLFSKTRGVNRFVGLVMGLVTAGVPNIDRLKTWVETTASLSNHSLEEEIEKASSPDLIKALEWSNAVNQKIKAYDGPVLAFEGVKQGLEHLKTLGKVIVVSSANKEAVQEEWEHQGLLEHTDDLYCQDRGKKEDVIAQLIAQGYAKENMMMIGDSPGDLRAAELNGIAFYPILVGFEKQSWESLVQQTARSFVTGAFDEQERQALIETFWSNLE